MDKPASLSIIAALCIPALVVVAYIASVLWRVGSAELALFKRNYLLLPVSTVSRSYDEPGTAQSFGEATFSFTRHGVTLHVYKQLINSFQHVYGSALTTYDLGDSASDFLFRGNEYAESIFSRPSGTEYFFLDTKKDLANNLIGRDIGNAARKHQLSRADAEAFMQEEIVTLMSNKRVYNHFHDPRVARLPSLNDYGCPLLGKIQEMRSVDKSLNFH